MDLAPEITAVTLSLISLLYPRASVALSSSLRCSLLYLPKLTLRPPPGSRRPTPPLLHPLLHRPPRPPPLQRQLPPRRLLRHQRRLAHPNRLRRRPPRPPKPPPPNPLPRRLLRLRLLALQRPLRLPPALARLHRALQLLGGGVLRALPRAHRRGFWYPAVCECECVYLVCAGLGHGFWEPGWGPAAWEGGGGESSVCGDCVLGWGAVGGRDGVLCWGQVGGWEGEGVEVDCLRLDIGVASRMIDGLETQVLQPFCNGGFAIGIPWHLRRRRRQNNGEYPHSYRHAMAPSKSPPWTRLARICPWPYNLPILIYNLIITAYS